MTLSSKLAAGSPFPELMVLDDQQHRADIRPPQGGADWKMLVIYRGRHCPLCTKYLNQLEDFRERLQILGVDLAAVSADSKAQIDQHRTKLSVNYPIYHGLSLEQMKSLGLYISHPRSEKETDHPFAEPGLFVLNQKGTIQVTDISNNPFVRPHLDSLVSGLDWIRRPENNYPIRGTLEY